MTKKIIALTCVILIGLTVNAQNETKARQILDKTANVVSNKGGASAHFTISGAKTGTTSGTIYIKGNKFHATTPEASVWFDGKTQWAYMKDTEEVNVNTPTEAQQAQMNPYQFINLYKKGYRLSMKNAKGGYEVHMTASQPKRAIKEMYITINSKSYQPTSVKLLQNGKWTNISISQFKASNLNDEMFRFNSKDFPEAEIIDLR